jgi:NAD(P)-dependent dehydrogenase (short-subunit alcohol dehydrogenase family)
MSVMADATLVALVTGGSRGVGGATAQALARAGYRVISTYRNKQARAEELVDRIRQQGGQAMAVCCDITRHADVDALFAQVHRWGGGRLDVLVLNASGGLERDLLAADPDYPMHINRDAQLLVLAGALPLLSAAGRGVVVFVTSHWAHLYGQIEQLPSYEPIAASKYAGELALRARMKNLARSNIRLLVITGDLLEGTITPKLLERAAPGVMAHRRGVIGQLPTAEQMGEAVAAAALDASRPSGQTVVVGGTLESMLPHSPNGSPR